MKVRLKNKGRVLSILSTCIFFLFIAYLIFSADMDHDNLLMELAHQFKYGDKLGHFLLFGMLSRLLNQALGYKKVPLWNAFPLLGSLIVLTLAIGEEFSQLAFSSRTFDVGDMLFDLLGIGWFNSVHFSRSINLLFSSVRSVKKS